jgi:hypothetical protein
LQLVTAIQAVDAMVKALDFDRKMLYLATQRSYKTLLSALQAFLKTVAIGDKADTLIDGMTLIGCIIRLVLKPLNDKATDSCWSFWFSWVLRSTDQSIDRLPQLWDEVNLMPTTAILCKDASGWKGHGQVRYCGLSFVCC